MPAFWPGIGKQKVKNVHRIFRQQITNRIRALQMKDPQIIDSGCFSADLGHPAGHAFNSQKIPLRMALGQGKQKQSVPAAKINMQRRNPPKDFRKIQRPNERFRNDLDPDALLLFRGSQSLAAGIAGKLRVGQTRATKNKVIRTDCGRRQKILSSRRSGDIVLIDSVAADADGTH